MFKQVVQRVKRIINPVVIISLVNATEGGWDEEPEDKSSCP
jgi:hypothetical protein